MRQKGAMQRLRDLHDRLCVEMELSCDQGLGSVGLILYDRLSHEGYHTTPLNSTTFAHTGVDGTHYGFLLIDDRAPELSPVVMSVPMSDRCNVIVGEDLLDFLCLGCEYGYCWLDELCHGEAKTVATLESPLREPHVGDRLEEGQYQEVDVEWCHEKQAVLGELRSCFSLTPWKDIADKLRDLYRRYAPLLNIRDPLE